MTNLKKSLDEIHSIVKRLLEEKRVEEPDPADSADEGYTDLGTGAETNGVGGGRGIATGVVRDRRDALQRLAEVAAYFQRAEPHSPVAYPVQRAVKWGNMPLESWLTDVIKDENVLAQLRQTLGFDTGSDSWGSSGNGDPSSETTTESSDDSW